MGIKVDMSIARVGNDLVIGDLFAMTTKLVPGTWYELSIKIKQDTEGNVSMAVDDITPTDPPPAT